MRYDMCCMVYDDAGVDVDVVYCMWYVSYRYVV